MDTIAILFMSSAPWPLGHPTCQTIPPPMKTIASVCSMYILGIMCGHFVFVSILIELLWLQ